MKSTRFAAVMSCAALFSACGGGGSSPPPCCGATAEGAYSGSITGGTAPTFYLLVLEDGSYWSMYGTQGASAFYVTGFVEGAGTSNNGTFTSSDARDFGHSPAVSGTVSATYTPTSISGKVTGASGSETFNGNALTGTTYNYNTPAKISDVAGAWNLTLLNGETLSINISAAGSFGPSVSSLGCSISGTVTPRPSGKNVFNVSLLFGAGCSLVGQTATGIALDYPLTVGTQIIFAGIDNTRQFGTAAFGVR